MLEIDDSLGGYRDRFPGPGIPALSCRSGSDSENAEVPEFDGIPGGQSLLHGRQEEIDRHLGIFLVACDGFVPWAKSGILISPSGIIRLNFGRHRINRYVSTYFYSELFLAKARVAGSNPVSRSSIFNDFRFSFTL